MLAAHQQYLAPARLSTNEWVECRADEASAEIKRICHGEWPYSLQQIKNLAASQGWYLHILPQAPLAGFYVDRDIVVAERRCEIATLGAALHEISERLLRSGRWPEFPTTSAHDVARVVECRYKTALVFVYEQRRFEAERREAVRAQNSRPKPDLTYEPIEYELGGEYRPPFRSRTRRPNSQKIKAQIDSFLRNG